MDDEARKHIAQLAELGFTPPEIAKRLSVAQGDVRRILRPYTAALAKARLREKRRKERARVVLARQEMRREGHDQDVINANLPLK